jgi:hypothetical protein
MTPGILTMRLVSFDALFRIKGLPFGRRRAKDATDTPRTWLDSARRFPLTVSRAEHTASREVDALAVRREEL